MFFVFVAKSVDNVATRYKHLSFDIFRVELHRQNAASAVERKAVDSVVGFVVIVEIFKSLNGVEAVFVAFCHHTRCLAFEHIVDFGIWSLKHKREYFLGKVVFFLNKITPTFKKIEVRLAFGVMVARNGVVDILHSIVKVATVAKAHGGNEVGVISDFFIALAYTFCRKLAEYLFEIWRAHSHKSVGHSPYAVGRKTAQGCHLLDLCVIMCCLVDLVGTEAQSGKQQDCN